VARVVFGNENEVAFRDFMKIIIPQMLGIKTNLGDNRHIDVTEYLHLSVIGNNNIFIKCNYVFDDDDDVLSYHNNSSILLYYSYG